MNESIQPAPVDPTDRVSTAMSSGYQAGRDDTITALLDMLVRDHLITQETAVLYEAAIAVRRAEQTA